MSGRSAQPGFDVDDDRVARVAWSALADPGDGEAQRLVAELGPAGALRQVFAGTEQERWRERLPLLDPDRDLQTMRRVGGRLLVPGDEEWPPGLDDLDTQAPFCLWVRGPLHLADATHHAAAVVGARACTPYGEHVATELAAECARRGITVVSGAAYGIDGCAHRATLTNAGATIAVLPCGIDRAYPRGHEQLIRRIGDDGAVISEIPPGRPPTRRRFLERNRLIAALSRATVVVEAAHHSGSRTTALCAIRLRRPVGAVPGPITSAASYGCHRLLRDDGAICITSADDIVELAAPAEQCPTQHGPAVPPEGASADTAPPGAVGPARDA